MAGRGAALIALAVLLNVLTFSEAFKEHDFKARAFDGVESGDDLGEE
jgi:hypothetical protein